MNEEATTDTQLDSEFEREAAIKEKKESIPEHIQKFFEDVKTQKKRDTGIKSSGESDD